HRQPQALRGRYRVEDRRRQSPGLGAEHEVVAWLETAVGRGASTPRRQCEQAGGAHCLEVSAPVGMHPDPGELVVVEPGAAQAAVLDREAEWLDQVQGGAAVR